jgi:hypothetical protein
MARRRFLLLLLLLLLLHDYVCRGMTNDSERLFAGNTGNECYYGANRTPMGGLVSRDFTQGYGPEEYMIRNALPGKYIVKAKYYASHSMSLSGGTTILLTIHTNFGRPDKEQCQRITIRYAGIPVVPMIVLSATECEVGRDVGSRAGCKTTRTSSPSARWTSRARPWPNASPTGRSTGRWRPALRESSDDRASGRADHANCSRKSVVFHILTSISEQPRLSQQEKSSRGSQPSESEQQGAVAPPREPQRRHRQQAAAARTAAAAGESLLAIRWAAECRGGGFSAGCTAGALGA